ncbi:right-handed parallel beta-helix repeat-containing protein [Halosquirtibacter xylanolyticus]|uniref:right-handed parallel beta-helix repeat-containing protein n=1 Tax=Halosquirtibacter xylanolyticus TaxID=3374599 RepID=UPI003749B15C|nr:right-handed parallel beta-helix repeat-containing protein [Prolixibacteraceae bacterium]
MKNIYFLLSLWLLIFLGGQRVNAQTKITTGNKYVSPLGNDVLNNGSKVSPFKSIKFALSKIKAGDTLYVREGNYHEELHVNGIKASSGAPVVIVNYNNERVVVDGSLSVSDLSKGGWQSDRDNIYKIKLNDRIWQLFNDGKWSMLARWPNASFQNDNAWKRELWCQGDEKRSKITTNAVGDKIGVEYDDPHGGIDLKNIGVDLDNAMVVLNVFNFFTYAKKVTEHHIGEDHFSYKAGGVQLKPVFHHYFFDSKYELIDEADEWYYNPKDSMLYYKPLTVGVPSGVKVRNIDKALSIEASENIKVVGIHFFSAGVRVSKSNYISFEDCKFDYPCFNKRTLGKTGAETGLLFDNCRHSSIINCELAYTDGLVAKFQKGSHNLVENCLLHDLDYSVAPHQGNSGFIWFRNCPNSTFRRNEVYQTGASEGVMASGNSIIELNKIHDIHPLQHDGAMVHFFMGANDSEVRNNWFYNNTKRCIRMQDGPKDVLNPRQGPGLVRNNVNFNTPDVGMMLKGDYKKAYHNLSLERIDFADTSKDPASGIHKNSKSANNATRDGVSFKAGDHKKNWDGKTTGLNLEDQVYDWINRDFRPRLESELIDQGVDIGYKYVGVKPDIGAYEWGDKNYWIPGRKLVKSSMPIPNDKGATSYSLVDLMWLPAYKAEKSDVYISTSLSEVTSATPSSLSYKGRLDCNVYHPSNLMKGTKYYWRVDGVLKGAIVKGNIWEFTAGESANIAKNTLTIDVYGKNGAKVETLSDVKVVCTGVNYNTNPLGRTVITPIEDNVYTINLSKAGYHPKSFRVNVHGNVSIKDTLEQDLTSSVSSKRSMPPKFILYPIPVNQVVNIECNTEVFTYQVISSTGVVITEQKVYSKQVRVDLSTLGAGNYFMKIETAKGVLSKQFTKR